MQNLDPTPTVESLVQQALAQPHIPRAAYRFQFSPAFTFQDALACVPYLDELGVSTVYASPIFTPRAGSQHGYDICNHNEINPALGGDAGFAALTAALAQRRMGLLLDVVPNHMGIGDTANAWWMDVLENGPSSFYAPYFDIEWHPVKLELADKVLLPVLEDQYGQVLEDGKLRLIYEDSGFFLMYYELRLPLAPRTYIQILHAPLDTLTETLEADDVDLQEYQSILTALGYLPPRSELDPEKLVERNREKEVIKRRIGALYQSNAAVRAAIDTAVEELNGRVGDPHSFDGLDELIDAQAYRPAFWRVAAEEINYRRFFDINDLAAIRTEELEVFQATHTLVFRLLVEGQAAGLRLDHIDGLYDPTTYLRRLQEDYVVQLVKARLGAAAPDDATLAEQVATLLEPWFQRQADPARDGPPSWPLYVVAEKILGPGEALPQAWTMHGTTGYDFLTAVNGLFVDQHNSAAFDSIYRAFTEQTTPFDELINRTKKMIMLVSMASELYMLAHQLERIAEKNRRYRDFTLDTLTFALREVIAALPVYRTYSTTPETVTPRDRQFIELAVAKARQRNPRTARAIFDFIKETLLLRNLARFSPDDHEQLVRWVCKFQQLTGPIMAKGVEDTAFYVFNRLVSLNEVGGHPDHFGTTVAAFHEQNSAHQRTWPHTLLTTSTHDTKRSEDVRARINVLSELPADWGDALNRWGALNAAHKTEVDGMPAPDRNDEYLFYQTLIGAWPFELLADGRQPGAGDDREAEGVEPWAAFRERIAAYMQKATKEAKVHTSWVNPNQDYDTAVWAFVERALDATASQAFLADSRALARRVAHSGQWNSLAQVLLKLTAPGVPDLYQGAELWDLSLVDPDNRRPVDYDRRRTLLAGLQQQIEQAGDDLLPLAQALLASSTDGRIKLYLTQRALSFRRRHPQLFGQGDYHPLEAIGERQAHCCAFMRTLGTAAAVVIVPRLVVGLIEKYERPPLGAGSWGATWLALPGERVGQGYRNWLTGERLIVEEHAGTAGLRLKAVLANFPVALLERGGGA
jgi:(1->4)-alpha-D-glucan 1-alpha-D-glucosylmutase